MRACEQLVVERPDLGRRSLALLLEVADLRAQVQDPGLELLLLRLEAGRGLDERRPLLGRVSDARRLGRQLGRDQEAQAQQGHAEGDLPGGDGPDPGQHRHASAASCRRRHAYSPTTARTVIADHDDRQDDRRRRHRCSRRRTWSRRRSTAASSRPGAGVVPGAGLPAHAGGTGPGRRRLRAVAGRRRPPRATPARRRRTRSASMPRAWVNASSSVRPSAYERTS